MYLNQIFENLQKYYTYFNTDFLSFSTIRLVMFTCCSKLSYSLVNITYNIFKQSFFKFSKSIFKVGQYLTDRAENLICNIQL